MPPEETTAGGQLDSSAGRLQAQERKHIQSRAGVTCWPVFVPRCRAQRGYGRIGLNLEKDGQCLKTTLLLSACDEDLVVRHRPLSLLAGARGRLRRGRSALSISLSLSLSLSLYILYKQLCNTF